MLKNKNHYANDSITVTELNKCVRQIIENNIGDLWVHGEISKLTLHSSGHWYFTLKDDKAAVACAMFQRDNINVTFKLKDGQKVFVFARPSLYEISGRYQLIVLKMEEAGKGDLQKKFELLKNKLNSEGLFDSIHKKNLPYLPKKIGVITSPTGAAIKDIINVVLRRYPNMNILLAPTIVQGEHAAKSIVNAIKYMNTRSDLDVLIVGRGGGSKEDLWAFNEEEVAREIFLSKIPIISAVGHEIDFTISDFVADVRAPTPSAAAELAVPEKSYVINKLKSLDNLMNKVMMIHYNEKKISLNELAYHPIFHEPKHIVLLLKERISTAHNKIVNNLNKEKALIKEKLNEAKFKKSQALERKIRITQQQVDDYDRRIKAIIEKSFVNNNNRVSIAKNQLRALSPKSVINRGYSISTDETGGVITSVKNVKKGQGIVTILKDGKISSVIKDKNK